MVRCDRLRLCHSKKGLGDLLDTHAFLLDGKQFWCGQDHSRCENACKQLANQTNVAVVHRWRSRVSDVGRCEMCQKSMVLAQFLKTGTFFIKRGQSTDDHFLFWASLFHATIPQTNYILTPETQGKLEAPKRKRAKAGRPPCTCSFWISGESQKWKYAACDWVVSQHDFDGGNKPWFVMIGPCRCVRL